MVLGRYVIVGYLDPKGKAQNSPKALFGMLFGPKSSLKYFSLVRALGVAFVSSVLQTCGMLQSQTKHDFKPAVHAGLIK